MTPNSFIRLGYYFFKRLVMRLVGRGGGLPLFESNYVRGDGLAPLSRTERAALPEFGRCIACAACDVHARTRMGHPASMPGPSALPLSFSRSLPDLGGQGAYLASLRRLDLVQLEQLCPTRVPFRRLVTFVEQHGGDATPASPGSPAP